MIKIIWFVGCCFISSIIYADNPIGFLWYNLPKEQKLEKSHHPRGISFNRLSYTDKDKVLRYYTLEALHKVRFTHKLEDERAFLAWQSFWLREASIHGKLNDIALRYYPQYDFSVTHPTSNLGTKISDTFTTLKVQLTIKQLAKTHGLLFFYRGGNAFDRAQIPILIAFCQTYHFTLLAVSVDGMIAPELPTSRINQGQVERLKLQFFPALFLVQPKQHTNIPLAFGLTTQDVLIRRLMSIVWEDAA